VVPERLVAVTFRADEASRRAIVEVIGGDARVAFLKDLPEPERTAALEAAEVLVAWIAARELRDLPTDRAKDLEFVQLLSAGVDPKDLAAIPERAQVASNVGAYAEPMAEHVMAMTLALTKRLGPRHCAMREGRWEQHLLSKTLDGAVCGIVGYGGIGRATARLMRAFGARIWAVNTSGKTDDDVEFVGTLEDLDRLLEGSDVLVLAVPLTGRTRGLIGPRELALMKPDAVLVNVARGAVVDQDALFEHLKTHHDFCAGIDTWWKEPLRAGAFEVDHPFLELANVIGSPHNSSLVPGIFTSATRKAAENVALYLRGEEVRGVVSREDYAELDS
jgi:phosphoglycerate dehydrogenase-like enzyme